MSREHDLEAMPGCLCYSLRKASRAMTHFFNSEISTRDLLPTQSPILTALSLHGRMGMAEMSESLAMDRTTLLRNLRPLEREGLVKAEGKGRGNKVTLSITAEGRRLLARFLPHWRKAQRKAVAVLGEDRWRQILRDLDRAALALQS